MRRSDHHPVSLGPSLRDHLWMPLSGGRHPATDAIVPAHHAWLAHHGLLDGRTARVFERARFHELAGLVHHRDDAETLRLAADFIATLFVLDDLMDTAVDPAGRDHARAREAMAVVRHATHSGHAPSGRRVGVTAVASGMADLTRRLRARGAPLDAYLAEVDRYLDGVVEEARRRSTGFASVTDYAGVRVAFSAVYACVELGLAARGAPLPEPLRPLARLANLSVSWVNDVWSWPKERALGERSNLVAVLMETEARGEPDAVRLACRWCDQVMSSYLEARAALASSPDLAPGLALLEGWIRGNLDWHAHGTARYAEHLSVAPVAA